MDSNYAETLNSFAYDLANIWKDKNKFKPANSKPGQDDGNCSLNRFLLSASAKNIGHNHQNVEYLNNTQRLVKTSSIWIQPDFSRIDVEKILQEFEIGIFIVRVNSDKKTMVLSYRTEDKVQHVKIKVDLRNGFYMDGSQNIFKNVNSMISHYMSHSIQTPDLLLKLPRVLRESSVPAHFKFFENLKSDFWKTSLPNKSINEIFIKSSDSVCKESFAYYGVGDNDSTPPLPPRDYDDNDLTYIQGLADEVEPDSIIYNEIVKEDKLKPKVKPKMKPLKEFPSVFDDKFSEKYISKSDVKFDLKSDLKSDPECDQISSSNIYQNVECRINKRDNRDVEHSHISESLIGASITTEITILSEDNPSNGCSDIQNTKRHSSNSVERNSFLIKDIIKYYYPQILHLNYICKGENIILPSLTQDIVKDRNVNLNIIPEKETQSIKSNNSNYKPISIDEGEYDIPWELKNPWISKYMDIENYEGVKQSEYMEKIIRSDSYLEKSKQNEFSSSSNLKDSCESVNVRKAPEKGESSLPSSKKGSIISFTDDDDDDKEIDEKLQYELLAEIQQVVYSSTNSPIYNQRKSPYGQSIRKYLIQLCSRKGHSDISISVRTFIQCTMERSDLSPYTTMRLMRQYMSGLKNMIKQQKSEYSFLAIIEDERKKTPKNVFINFESIIESVLTKAVVKPLASYVYQLLVLEHYKNNNLKLISEGVEEAQASEPKKLGLEDSSISIINSKIHLIKNKFRMMAKQYAPEKKIGQIISIIEIIFEIVKLIYPETRPDSMRIDFKSDYLLPILVYIFSQCKTDAIATQCEVEYIEGLIWSSTLVDGEPGFYLMNIMSSLEAIKVLARPQLNSNNIVDLRNNEPVKISNSSFFTKINPATISTAAIGSVNVIILDEKLSRLVTRTFPVRSTVTVGNLCNSISHRLGIFNPKEYNLYKYTGTEDILLNEFEYPLTIKQTYQQKTGETLNFLFKRKNAAFILPSFIPMK